MQCYTKWIWVDKFASPPAGGSRVLCAVESARRDSKLGIVTHQRRTNAAERGLFRTFWWNLILRKIKNEGCGVILKCSDCKTVPLDSSLTLRPFVVIKSHFRGNRDLWWSVNLFTFCMTSQRPSDTGILKAQSSPGILAPRQEFSGGGQSTEVAIADNSGDDRSGLELRDGIWAHRWEMPVLSLEHHRG